MNLPRVRTVIDKEWAEVFKNKLVLFTVGFLPLIFTALPLGIFYVTSHSAPNTGDLADLPASFQAMCAGAGPADCLQLYLLNEFLLLFMMMPLIIPVSIAAYSIVGEKTTRSLEPLLATPISTIELLTAKGLAAALPAIAATWAGFTVFLIGLPLVGGGAIVVRQVLSPVWLLAIFVISPLMSVLAVVFALMVSSRASDPRVAEQTAAVIIAPLLAVLFGQLAGVIVLNVTFMLVAIVLLALIDLAMVYLGARLFQRENILTRWK
ncbi:MAG: ABC transporter permease subunit [Anaerolineales bacterium]|nr:ABC transporter permease subunit [Anaerolineales bacterium]